MAELKWYGDKAIKNIEQAVNVALTASALLVEGQAKALAPVDTGNLRNSITHELGKKEARVGTNVEYAQAVEFGTSPHTISIKDKKVLSDGKTFFGKTVQHPGTAPQPFLNPALETNKSNIKKIFADAIKEAMGD